MSRGCLFADFVRPIICQVAGNCWNFECPGPSETPLASAPPVPSLSIFGTCFYTEQSMSGSTHPLDALRCSLSRLFDSSRLECVRVFTLQDKINPDRRS